MNALNELKEIINLEDIKCAKISLNRKDIYNEETKEWKESPYNSETILKIGYSIEDLNTFKNELNKMEYYAGYGIQELYGTVWLKNGDWLERREYDGSEWWNYCTCPTIPENLL